jgi:hypothetical protein
VSDWTLRALRDGGYGLELMCRDPACGVFMVVDIPDAIASHGEDYVVPLDVDDLACPQCKGPLKVVVVLPQPPELDA